MTSPEPIVQIKKKSQNYTSYGSSLLNKGATRALDKKRHLLNHWSKFNIISQNVPYNALHQNCTNSLAVPSKKATRVLDKKYLKITSPTEPLIQMQNNFTEIFLMMPSTKIVQRWPPVLKIEIS